MGEEWLHVPVGPDAKRWVTAMTHRTVLAVVHTVAGAGHLLDAVELLECDSRLQVVFTQAPDVHNNGVSTVLAQLGAVVIPWHQATRLQFDLALVTDAASVHEIRAPIMFLPHGVMNNKRTPADLTGSDRNHLVVGLAAPWLTWYGRLVPAVVALSHIDLLGVLAQQCPQALPAARLVGDLCLDRLATSRTERRRYRRTLGVADGQTLVAVCSTWGRQSLFARHPNLAGELTSALPKQQYAVVLVLHPAVWFGHGPRQVLAWLREQRQRGLMVVDPLSWRGLVAAADVVIGDHGSATLYAAGVGVPVLRAPWAMDSVKVGSTVGALAAMAPVLNHDEPWEAQLDAAAATFTDQTKRAVAARITSQPGRAARLLQRQMYLLLGMAKPHTQPEAAPVGAARPVGE
jgi:hypothetical protein